MTNHRHLYRIHCSDCTLYVKVKHSIGNWLGLQPIAITDPIFFGTFGGNGPNTGAKYFRRIGGFRVASYTLVSWSYFSIEGKRYRSIQIGFPNGHSVSRFLSFLEDNPRLNEIAAVVTPAGHKIPITPMSCGYLTPPD